MKCPQCNSHYEPTSIGSIVYWQCHTCNSLWFDNQEAQYVSLQEAENIARTSTTARLVNKKNICPRCQAVLEKNELGFQCARCGGQLTDSKRLVEIKKTSVETYHKTHTLFSFSQLKSSVILSLVAVFLFVNYLIIHSFQTRNTLRSEASSQIQNIRIENTSDHKIAIVFTTKKAYSSEAVVVTGKQQKTYTINETPRFSHLLIIDTPSDHSVLTVVLKDKNGQKAITQQVRLP
ncbi:MAG: zf-TFIIB domain-containing protein [Candidatus Roizmanbacteria bacterium]|nr:zf-TFIIB domain-containing protein [Candidatus Roizmanbacteria bacterium]